MSESSLQAMIEGANAYESLMVPALFEEWAPRVAGAARIRPGERVLDLACGTGVLGREVARRVGPDGSVIELDPSPGMLAVARRLESGVEWQEGAAERLPFPDESFDAVVSQFGLMFFEDRPRALREALRVLVPEGRLVVAVWDFLDRIPAYRRFVALVERMAGTQAADPIRAPFVLGDEDELVSLFAEAGAGSVEILTRAGTARFPSVRDMVEADLRGWLPLVGVVLSEERISAILVEAERELGRYGTLEGRMVFDMSAHLITAQKT